MLNNLKVAQKIALMPIVAAIALLIIVLVAPRAATRNSELLQEIEEGFFPASELGRDLAENLAVIQRDLQDAVAAVDETILDEADAAAGEFRGGLAGAAGNPTLDARVLSDLEAEFDRYYSHARATSLRLIRGESGDQLTADLRTMRDGFERVHERVQNIRSESHDRVGKAFASAEANQERSSMILSRLTVFAVVCLLALVVFSFLLVRSLTMPIRSAVEVAGELAEGDLSAEIEISSSDEMGQLLQAMSRTSQYMRETAVVAEAIAAGDLSVEVEPRSGHDTLGIAFQSMARQLSETIGDLRAGVQLLSNASAEVSATSQTLSQGTSEQAASVEQAAASLEEMTASITQNAANSRQMEQMALTGSQTAEESGQAVNETVEAMQAIADKISIVEEISYQTNLLALNAAIEAARAGEHGRGFAVVATEVRKLAERSQSAAKEISELAASSVKVAERSGQLLVDMVPSIRRTAELVQEVAAASDEQSSGVSQINGAMSRVDQVAQRNASAAEELSATSQEMATRADSLQQRMKLFRLRDAHAAGRVPEIEVEDLEERAAPPARPPRKASAADREPDVMVIDGDRDFERF